MSLLHRFVKMQHHISDVTVNCNQLEDDMLSFLEIVHAKNDTASKKTHYHELDAWSTDIYMYLHKMLKKYGFRNGEPLYNDKIPEICVWWCMYGIVGSIHHSEYLVTTTQLHHASAWSRNDALRQELERIIALF